MFEDWKIAIIGAGTQGHSIGIAYALGGFAATIVDSNPAQLEKAEKMVADSIETLCSAGLVNKADIPAALKRITYTTDLAQAVANANVVHEAVFEAVEAKKDIFANLDKLCPANAILASNTSTLNIYEFIEISHPERMVIAHWCTPPHIMPLVEIVRGPQTSDQTAETMRDLLINIGKKPSIVNQVIPGFILNRIGLAIFREACYIAGQGWASPEDVDAALRNTYGIRWPFEGPLELRDYIGWDVSLKVGSYVIPHLCSSTEAVGTAVELTEKGWLGVKSGRGLKDYSQVDVAKILKERSTKILKVKNAVKALNDEFPA